MGQSEARRLPGPGANAGPGARSSGPGQLSWPARPLHPRYFPLLLLLWGLGFVSGAVCEAKSLLCREREGASSPLSLPQAPQASGAKGALQNLGLRGLGLKTTA